MHPAVPSLSGNISERKKQQSIIQLTSQIHSRALLWALSGPTTASAAASLVAFKTFFVVFAASSSSVAFFAILAANLWASALAFSLASFASASALVLGKFGLVRFEPLFQTGNWTVQFLAKFSKLKPKPIQMVYISLVSVQMRFQTAFLRNI